MNRIGIGLIGSGFMGRAHALAFRQVAGVFNLPRQPELELLADVDEATATAAATALGFNRSSADWQALINDPRVDIVAITTPNVMHKPMALAAIKAGKAVYCEKPLAASLADAESMAQAAQAAQATTLVGFNYLKNPMIALAREIITSGEIGDIISFRGIHAEDYMCDPDAPYTWRCEPEGGGVTADLGSHIISLARYLVGDIVSVCAHMDTVYSSRPIAPGATDRREVTVDDQAHFLACFSNGASGSMHASWLAVGRKMQLAFEIVGNKGSLDFTQERFNELRLSKAGQIRGREGFTTIVAGPDHPDYAGFCPAPGHQLGFNDLKVIEVKELLLALAEQRPATPDFNEALQIARTVEAVMQSAKERRWLAIGDV